MSQLSAEAGEGGAESEEKKAKRARHLELTNELTRDMLPVLLAVYSTSAGPGVRHSCIQVGSLLSKVVSDSQLNRIKPILMAESNWELVTALGVSSH